MEFDEIISKLNEIKSGLLDSFSSGSLDMDGIISKLDSLPAMINEIRGKSGGINLTHNRAIGAVKVSENIVHLPLLAIEDYR